MKDTNLHLFRTWKDFDTRWSHVGPHHERLHFNLLDLVGYAPVHRNDSPPYRLYDVYGWTGVKMAENSYDTLQAVKIAGREHALQWLKKAGDGPVIWTGSQDTGRHWYATADGLHMASYYYSPTKTPEWPKAFKVYFGGTFYTKEFKDPDEAKQQVEATWRQWIEVAKDRLFEGTS